MQQLSYETAKSYKKGKTTNKVFSLLFLWLDPGSEIRDPGSGNRDGKNQDPGSRINIPDPQHCIISTLIDTPCNRAIVFVT